MEEGCDDGIVSMHLRLRLMQIIDLAPLVLGIFAYLLGRSADRRLEVEREAQRVAAEYAAKQEALSQQLQEQNDVLRNLNTTLDGLVYTASHDLKTPVINLESMVRMLRDVMGKPDSEVLVANILERIDAAAARFNLTVTNLLEVSRASRDLPLDLHGVSLRDVVAAVRVHLLEHLGSQGAKIHLDLQHDLVLGTEETLENVFQNLVTNAIKFRDPSRTPEILISSRLEHGWVEVRVEDNGLGIDLEQQGAKVFKMFQRIHGIGEGAGVGLYLVHRTLQRLGGEVSLESTPGKGTTFTLLFQNANQE